MNIFIYYKHYFSQVEYFYSFLWYNFIKQIGGQPMATIKEIIKSTYEQLSLSEKKVAGYILNHYQDSVLMSSSEIAVASGSSHTAVIRFTKALGFHGFLEYKKTLREEFSSSQKVYTYLKKMDNPDGHGLSTKYLQSYQQRVDRFVDELDDEVLAQISQSILDAKHVYLLGIGADVVIPRFLENYIKIMGIPCTGIGEVGLTLKEGLLYVHPEDVVIMSAFPTLLDDERWAASHCNKAGAKVIVLSDSEVAAQELGASLFYNVGENQDMFFNSYSLAMVFCNLLLLRLYELAPQRVESALKRYQEMLEQAGSK